MKLITRKLLNEALDVCKYTNPKFMVAFLLNQLRKDPFVLVETELFHLLYQHFYTKHPNTDTT